MFQPTARASDPAIEFHEVLHHENEVLGAAQTRAALCLSGGGIRSATFCLGVLQALAEARLFPLFDYLSTVSGGGYIGAWLSAWIHRAGANKPISTLADGAAEPYRYLRSNAQYLRSSPSSAAPGPAALFGMYGQKAALTLFLMLPALAGMVMLSHLLVMLSNVTLPASIILIAAAILAALVQISTGRRSLIPQTRRKFSVLWYLLAETTCALCSVGLIPVTVFTTIVCYVVAAAISWIGLGFRLTVLPALLLGIATQVTAVVLLGKIAISEMTPEDATLAFALAAILGRIVTNAVFCTLLGFFDKSADVSWAAVARSRLISVALFLTAAHTAAFWMPRAWSNLTLSSRATAVAAVVISAAIFAALVYSSVELNPRDKKTGKLPLHLAVLFQLAALITVAGLLGGAGIWIARHAEGWNLIEYVLGPMILAPLVAGFFVDANSLSLHDMYRDSLVRAFLGASHQRDPDPLTNLDPADDVALRDLCHRPFHVFCAARKNIGPLSDTPFERVTESFVFTPLYCGSSTLKYRPTVTYAGSLTVGTAIAASGAAVNTNLAQGSGHIALLRTILNPHLGLWLPNPGLSSWLRTRPPFAQAALLKDLTGAGSARDPFIYVSDGGHFENLGLYEMIRRRCTFIVVVDAGRDALGTDDDLANAISIVRTDLQADIELARSPREHVNVGYIRYHNEARDGILIYIKPVLTGDEPLEVANYAALNRDFPQETTADQFFTEAQFESYRILGFHSLQQILNSMEKPTIDNFFKAAAAANPPRDRRDSF